MKNKDFSTTMQGLLVALHAVSGRFSFAWCRTVGPTINDLPPINSPTIFERTECRTMAPYLHYIGFKQLKRLPGFSTFH
jgi:hypothetical protein